MKKKWIKRVPLVVFSLIVAVVLFLGFRESREKQPPKNVPDPVISITGDATKYSMVKRIVLSTHRECVRKYKTGVQSVTIEHFAEKRHTNVSYKCMDPKKALIHEELHLPKGSNRLQDGATFMR